MKKDEEIREYIDKSDLYLKGIGYTEHSFAHVRHVVNLAGEILETLGFSEREIDLEKKEAVLRLSVDVLASPVMDYFEISLGRMLMCKHAATYLGLHFRVIINKTKIL